MAHPVGAGAAATTEPLPDGAPSDSHSPDVEHGPPHNDDSAHAQDGRVQPHGGEHRAQIAFATPRRTLIPGRPTAESGFHFMINAFAHAQNVGLGDHVIENAGERTRAGATQPLLTGDWAMGYWRQRRGLVEALLMLNFEPLSVGNDGYPELGQSGEGLIDAQHTHQLVHQAMIALHPVPELSIFGGQGSATMGPPIFMHRASAPGPTVPRKHHKGENPHETFPVLGVSVHVAHFWFEASAFSARELTPEDSRFYPHPAAPESFAVRIRYDLHDFMEFQVSGERLRNQSATAPDVWQASTSAYLWRATHGWRFDALLDYAVDAPDGERASHAVLAEIAVRDPPARNVLWGRSEFNQREEPVSLGAGGLSSPWLFQSLGFERVVVASPSSGLQLGLFGEATLVGIPRALTDFYGQDVAVTLNVGVHLFGMWMLDDRYRRMRHDDVSAMHEMDREHPVRAQ